MMGGEGGDGGAARGFGGGGMLIAWLYLLNCLLVVLINALIDAEMKKKKSCQRRERGARREGSKQEGWRMKDYHGQHMEMAPL